MEDIKGDVEKEIGEKAKCMLPPPPPLVPKESLKQLKAEWSFENKVWWSTHSLGSNSDWL